MSTNQRLKIFCVNQSEESIYLGHLVTNIVVSPLSVQLEVMFLLKLVHLPGDDISANQENVMTTYLHKSVLGSPILLTRIPLLDNMLTQSDRVHFSPHTETLVMKLRVETSAALVW